MKKLFQLMLVLAVLLNSAIASASAFSVYSFTIQKKAYRFSTSFDIDSEETAPGKVNKSVLGIRTWYYLYDLRGKEEAYGICSFFCLGLFFDWATEIYVYRGNERLGWIDGQMGTTAAAKFSIYDRQGNRVGIAYLDQNKTGFEITDPETDSIRIASLNRHFVQGTVDHWKVIVYRPDIDPAILRIFATFAIDRQNSWKRDT